MTQTVLITGASSGLGAEMARQLADLGHDLALCARRTERLQALADEITGRHPERRVAVRALDVTDDTAVFEVFRALADELGGLDRVVVNAGLGKGAALGTGRYDANKQTAVTNFVAGLAQVEAAMEIFRAQAEQGRRGHLVVISSVSAVRGMKRAMTTYAATKAGIAALAEGLQHEAPKNIDVSIIYPGYIRSEMNEQVAQRTKFMVDTETGTRAIVDAIEKRKAKAYVPAWPWVPMATALKHLPLSVVRKLA